MTHLETRELEYEAGCHALSREMADVKSWNQGIIDEFPANGGKVGGEFAGAPPLLLITTGAESGEQRTNPVMCFADGDRLYVFASKAGAPTNPDWYHNLVANPRATVEVGTERYDVDASVLTGAERDRIYAQQAELYPGFAEYQEKTSRTIPVVALERIG
jgi:deazaflavin-dependent oxidoreductase (nitroreductase family)